MALNDRHPLVKDHAIRSTDCAGHAPSQMFSLYKEHLIATYAKMVDSGFPHTAAAIREMFEDYESEQNRDMIGGPFSAKPK